MLLANFIAGLVYTPVYYLLGYGHATLPTLALIPIFGLIWFGLWLAIVSGRRWALLIYIVWFVLGGYIQIVAEPSNVLGRGALISTWNLLTLSLDTVGVVLLIMPTSRAWFAASKAARRREARAS